MLKLKLKSYEHLLLLNELKLQILHMALKRANIGQIIGLLVEFLDLILSLKQLSLKGLDVFGHLGHFKGDAVGRLSHNLVHVHLRSDALGLAPKVERLERLLHISRQLRDATDDGGL